MALILHISDLHLSDLVDEQVVGDYKVAGLIPLAERQNRLDLLRSSLSSLERWLTQEALDLDAIVITGDVALAHSEAGFESLGATLRSLGTKALDPTRTLVVPGNHDVAWSTAPSSAERYKLFVDAVRGHGYVTPLLEGVDLDPSTGQLINNPSPPYLHLSDESALLIGVNSTNYSGSSLALPEAAAEALAEATSRLSEDAASKRALERLLLHDVARVSPAQLTAIRAELAQLPTPSEGGPLRLVALHHQLLPVSPDEEFKAFENLTNLGQVRAFLTSQEVNMVLHGHKHQSASYLDLPAEGSSATRSAPYLVSSAATVWRQSAMGHEFARLVHVDVSYPRGRKITVSSVPAAGAGSDIAGVNHVRTWRVALATDLPLLPCITGMTVDHVYDQLVAYFDQRNGRPVSRLSCSIEEGQTALLLPGSYPTIEGVDDKQAWLEEIVEWWQRPDPDLTGRGRRFNHGERIRNFVDRRDQLSEVVRALKEAPGTTRAIIQLIDPVRDNIGDATQRVPSFFSCHFLVREREERLDCIAYFRKQQIRMWWPVNVAEIASLQREAAQKLADAGLTLSCGCITTIAARAIDGTNKPRVVVPRVDRIAHDRPGELWGLVYDLFFGDFEASRDSFLTFLDDWRPTGQVEPDGSAISLGGVELLFQATSLFAERADSTAGRRLARALQDLGDTNQTYADAEDITTDPSERRVQYERWAEQVERRRSDIEAAIAGLGPPN